MGATLYRSIALLAACLGAAAARGEEKAMAGPQQAEIAARLPLPVGNLAFTPDGRMIVSHHPMFETARRVSVATSATTLAPFPNEAWNTPRPGAEDFLDSVLGVRGDAAGVVWMLDMGTRGTVTPKLVAWDTRNDRLARVIRLPAPATREESEVNDFVIDAANEAIYVTDEGVARKGDGSKAALIVVDLGTGASRRVLEGHGSTRPEALPMAVDGRDLVKTDKDGSTAPMRSGADGIALDHRSEWLYYGPLTGRAVYRVRTADLRNAALSDGDLGARVERYADRPNAGGMAMDVADNLYLAEIERRTVGVIGPGDRTYRPFATHPDLLWPDGFATSPDGRLYVTASQLPLSPPLNGGKDRSAPPYLIARVVPLAAGRVGR